VSPRLMQEVFTGDLPFMSVNQHHQSTVTTA